MSKIDLLLGGSPCQGFSIAGKRLNFDDPRSKLFFNFVDALKILKPKYFLFENVIMKKEVRDVISSYLGAEPIEINSALVSAQNRRRLYWTNIPSIQQPENKHIYLKDVVEGKNIDKLKLYSVDVNGFKGTNFTKYLQYLKKKGKQAVFEKPFRLGHFNSGGQGDRVYALEGKSISLSANGGGRGAKTGLYLAYDDIDYLLQHENEQDIEQIIENSCIRKLTPIECERLQTLPDNYTEGVSDTQRYKMLGNAWTVDVIAHILSFIPEKHLNVVVSLFDGISCGQVALERSGKTYDKYYASEIDKYAINITQKNYPNTIQIGDVTKIDWKKFLKTIMK